MRMTNPGQNKLINTHRLILKPVSEELWLKINAHGIGYGTEVVKALIDFAEKNSDIE